MSADALDEARMDVALRLARRGLGQSWPNPAVGCVIARDARILGRGHTQPGGRPHAEQVALAQARALWGEAALVGATAWITLEPCAHHGRTPPCADALVSAGIARAVVALRDPDPRVDGRGLARLREAGVDVVCGVRAAEAAALQTGFLARLARGRPWLTLKMAATLDGRIATALGESRWITGSAARARVHLLRTESDAILIGRGTAMADDPMLDVRLPGLEARQPVRVVMDAALALPLSTRLVRTAAQQPLWILHATDADAMRAAALQAHGARLVTVSRGVDGHLDPVAALGALGALGLTRLLCEGGGVLAGALLRAGLVDEIAWFSAGAMIGDDGRPALGPMGVADLAGAPRYRLADTERLGEDVLSRWRR